MINHPMPCPVRTGAKIFPDLPAIDTPVVRIPYAELDRQIDVAAFSLYRRGVNPGDFVGIYLSDPATTVISILALIRSGAVAVPLSTRIPELALPGYLAVMGASKIISKPFQQEIDGLDAIDPDLFFSDPKTTGAPGETLDAALPATVVFTSGSLGQPKAAVHTLLNHYYSALGSQTNIPLEPSDRWLLSLPLYHVSGLGILFRCLFAGATLVLPEDKKPIREILVDASVTHVSMVNTQLSRLVEGNSRAPEKLKAVLVGGGKLSGSLLTRAREQGFPVHTTYGLTECTSQVTSTPPNVASHLLENTAGYVLPHRQLRVNPDGEILVAGPIVFAGYATKDGLESPVDPDGFFATGDLGKLDRFGFLSVIGRKDNLFISGGENIQPEEIERHLLDHPGVRRVMVVPVADPDFGFKPVAFVDAEVCLQKVSELTTFLATRLPRFKIPKLFYTWPTGNTDFGLKPSRKDLTALAASLVASVLTDPA